MYSSLYLLLTRAMKCGLIICLQSVFLTARVSTMPRMRRRRDLRLTVVDYEPGSKATPFVYSYLYAYKHLVAQFAPLCLSHLSNKGMQHYSSCTLLLSHLSNKDDSKDLSSVSLSHRVSMVLTDKAKLFDTQIYNLGIQVCMHII